MTISAEKDVALLGPNSPILDHTKVTITVVEFSKYSYVVLMDDRTHPTYAITGILDYCLNLDQALNQAYKFLYEYDSAPARRPKIQTQLYISRALAPSTTSTTNALTGATSTPTTASDKAALRLTTPSWERLMKLTKDHNYHGRGHGMGVTAYLLATARANPTPAHWQDTRPNSAKQFDTRRLNAGKLPLWLPEEELRLKRIVNALHLPSLEHILTPVAEHFGIIARGGDVQSARAKTNAVIDMYGYRYLTPVNATPPNSRPANAKRREYRANRAKVHGGGITW